MEAFSQFGSQFIGDMDILNTASTGGHGPHEFDAEQISENTRIVAPCEGCCVSEKSDISKTQLNNDQNREKKT